MTYNRGKSIYFLKKVCNRRLTRIGLTRQGLAPTTPQSPPHPSTAETWPNEQVWGGGWPVTEGEEAQGSPNPHGAVCV